MYFTRNPQRYGDTPAPVTPYQRAAQEWDDRLGSSRVQAKNWRLMAFGCFGLALMLAGGMIWQNGQSRITPYVVEVDRLGEAKAITAAADSYRPSDAQVAWYLSRFVTNVRSLSSDPVVVRNNWLSAYDFATDKAAQFLNGYARTNDPFAQVGNRTVSVQVTSVVKASDQSYQVKWVEQTFEQGNLAATQNWTAILTVVNQTPRSPEVLRKNPLGIYVNGLDWSQEINSPTSR